MVQVRILLNYHRVIVVRGLTRCLSHIRDCFRTDEKIYLPMRLGFWVHLYVLWRGGGFIIRIFSSGFRLLSLNSQIFKRKVIGSITQWQSYLYIWLLYLNFQVFIWKFKYQLTKRCFDGSLSHSFSYQSCLPRLMLVRFIILTWGRSLVYVFTSVLLGGWVFVRDHDILRVFFRIRI